ncbi:elongation factor P 5-aminopentanone reductase [Neobacillus sp. SM06]|uniref:elongation factor P 5-aminopentanone reductase n=1 Tax=Neobacillus sp. SM06 TaxID=3422492 RepID=UPI003D29938F
MKKFVLITGASGGIGQATALKLAAKGYNLYLHYNQNEEAIKTVMEKLREFGGEFIPLKGDLAEEDGYKTIATQIFSLHAIVHCSGNSHYGLFVDLDQKTLERLMRIHVSGPMLLIKELLPKLLSRRSGSIVLISSIWGQTGAACEVAYSAAKGAQLSFVKALSKEVASSGIRVNAIAPGAVNTAMLDQFTSGEINQLHQEIPLGRLGFPEEIADSVFFLVSEESSYITGQVLAVNGGWYI